MPSRKDLEERRQTTRLFLAIAAVVVALVVVLVVFVAPSVSAALSPGLGLRGAAIAAFFVTLGVILLMLVAAGDGLLGEVQFALPAFGVFFVLIWMLIAWVF